MTAVRVAEGLRDRLYRRDPVFSFEFFPPRDARGDQALDRALDDLSPLHPAFISVTCGAAGSTRERTREIVSGLQRRYPFGVVAHVTGVGYAREELAGLVRDYRGSGIANFLALRGDPPRDAPDWRPPPDPPRHADEVVRIVREQAPDASIGVAGYPETHPEAGSLERDLAFLAAKVDAGADFVVTQMFFDNESYFHFVHHARRAGVRVPILPGIMPITRAGQIDRFRQLCGVAVPPRLERTVRSLEAAGDADALREVGVACCAAQCSDLLRHGAPGIHFFTLNQSRACHAVHAALQALDG